MGIGEDWETSESRSQLKQRCKGAGFKYLCILYSASCTLYPASSASRTLELATMVSVQNLSKAVSKEKILTNLTFHLEAGDRLGVLGTNGSGKSLLLHLLSDR